MPNQQAQILLSLSSLATTLDKVTSYLIPVLLLTQTLHGSQTMANLCHRLILTKHVEKVSCQKHELFTNSATGHCAFAASPRRRFKRAPMLSPSDAAGGS